MRRYLGIKQEYDHALRDAGDILNVPVRAATTPTSDDLKRMLNIEKRDA
jgi:hypothetical protein